MRHGFFRLSSLSLGILSAMGLPGLAPFGVVEGGGGGSAAPTDPPASTAPAPDLQSAAIAQALAEQQEKFREALKATTGHDSLEALQEERARQRGETDKLLAQRTEENRALRQQIEKGAINSALLGAAALAGAVNAGEIAQLLNGHAKVGSDGTVTVGGKPVNDAVADYLKANPHHAKPSGGQGSGAGSAAVTHGAQPEDGGVVNGLNRLQQARRGK